MNALEVINAATALLAPLGYPVHIGDFLEADTAGTLKVPTDVSQFIIHTVTGMPEHEWGSTRYGTVRLQVNAYSRVEGTALAMLALAEPLLVEGKFIPFTLVNLGRDGAYTGYAQDFERNV